MTYNDQNYLQDRQHKVWSSQVASAVKESKSQESCHLSEEEDVFDAEGVQVTNKGNSRDFFAISGKENMFFFAIGKLYIFINPKKISSPRRTTNLL